MRISDDTHLAPLLAALPDEPVGQPLDELADYVWLDEEMMKVGSLQHGEVDWAGAESRASRLLSERGKDLRVLGHLLHCLQHEGDAGRFALSLRLLAGGLDGWWESAHPYAGPRGARARPRLFTQFTQRAVKLAAGLSVTRREPHQALLAALETLTASARNRQLPLDDLEELQRRLQRLAPASEPSAAAPSRDRPATPDPTASPAPPPPPEARLEAGNERGNRQALLKMAEFLNEQDPGEALGYRLRRHAIWSLIQALPAARGDGRTELAPIAADRVADYREAIARAGQSRDGQAREGDGRLWLRIENSLALSPYWIEGHRLSATLAECLGHPRCAEAILDEAVRFHARLPGLETLRFNDGTPFVDDETLQWLQRAAPDATPASPGGGDPWQAGLAEARELLGAGDLAAALQRLDRGLAEARSPRDEAYWRLAGADLLREAGLTALAAQHYRALGQSVAGIGLEHWEPALLTRIEQASER